MPSATRTTTIASRRSRRRWRSHPRYSRPRGNPTPVRTQSGATRSTSTTSPRRAIPTSCPTTSYSVPLLRSRLSATSSRRTVRTNTISRSSTPMATRNCPSSKVSTSTRTATCLWSLRSTRTPSPIGSATRPSSIATRSA